MPCLLQIPLLYQKMASIKTNFILFIHFALCSFIHSQIVFASSRAAIFINPNIDFHQVCQRTTHSDTCISTISQDPQEDLKTNLIGLSTILNEKARAVAADILTKINGFLGGPITPPNKNLLQDAEAFITDADYIVYNLDFSSLNHQTYPEFKLDLEEAKANVTQTAPILSGLPANQSSLVGQNNLLENVIQTTLEIVNINECNKIETCTTY